MYARILFWFRYFLQYGKFRKKAERNDKDLWSYDDRGIPKDILSKEIKSPANPVYPYNKALFTESKCKDYELKGCEWIAEGSKVNGIGNFKEFILRIRINVNEELEGEFNILGGEPYTFLPYPQTTPVIGGIADHSIYKKTLKRKL